MIPGSFCPQFKQVQESVSPSVFVVYLFRLITSYPQAGQYVLALSKVKTLPKNTYSIFSRAIR